jgi:hypothetical protein
VKPAGETGRAIVVGAVDGDASCDPAVHGPDVALRARVLSVGVFIVLVGVWMVVLWPLSGGLSLGLVFANWVGVILAAVSGVGALMLWRCRHRFASVATGVSMSLVAICLSAFLVCDSVVGLSCAGSRPDTFGYSMTSLLMLVGGGLVFSWVLAPVDTSGCECSMSN